MKQFLKCTNETPSPQETRKKLSSWKRETNVICLTNKKLAPRNRWINAIFDQCACCLLLQRSLHNPDVFSLISGYLNKICVEGNVVNCKCLLYPEVWMSNSDTVFPKRNIKFQCFYDFVIWHFINTHRLICLFILMLVKV